MSCLMSSRWYGPSTPAPFSSPSASANHVLTSDRSPVKGQQDFLLGGQLDSITPVEFETRHPSATVA